jgi:hypothetical protein
MNRIHRIVAADQKEVTDAVFFQYFEDLGQIRLLDLMREEPRAEEGVRFNLSKRSAGSSLSSISLSSINPSMAKRIP